MTKGEEFAAWMRPDWPGVADMDVVIGPRQVSASWTEAPWRHHFVWSNPRGPVTPWTFRDRVALVKTGDWLKALYQVTDGR